MQAHPYERIGFFEHVADLIYVDISQPRAIVSIGYAIDDHRAFDRLIAERRAVGRMHVHAVMMLRVGGGGNLALANSP
ncbi:hypothetical protein [Dyella psychrodurans]|uniref:hypothetical protein n=1 Tax=Dyella psychrodurans TaxID=1927960 RepID=UPI001F356915|nr:hypothetical protein [Dyella psychrodurans]